MKVYISGKITGLPVNEVIDKFKYHEKLLILKGYKPVNPVDITPVDGSMTWNECMVKDIAILFECDAIYLMNDWGKSKGARVEYAIAKELGLTIIFEGELENKPNIIGDLNSGFRIDFVPTTTIEKGVGKLLINPADIPNK